MTNDSESLNATKPQGNYVPLYIINKLLRKYITMKIEELLTEDTSIEESLLSNMFGRLARRASISLRRATRSKPLTAQEKQFKKHMADIKTSLGKIKTGGFDLLSDIGSVLAFVNAAGVLHIVYKWYDNMDQAEQALESGKITQAQYDEEKRIQAGLLVTELATGLIGSKLLSAANGASILFKWLPFLVGPLLAASLKGMTEVAKTALWTALSTQEGATLLANLIGIKITEGAGSVAVSSVEKLQQLIGWASTKAGDAANAVVDKATGKQSPDTVGATPGAEVPNLKDFNKGAKTNGGGVGAGAANVTTTAPYDKNEYISRRFVRDPETGQLKYKLD